jgi:hypothetical protein
VLTGRYVDFLKSFILGVSSLAANKTDAVPSASTALSHTSTRTRSGVNTTSRATSGKAKGEQCVVAQSAPETSSVGRGKGGLVTPSLANEAAMMEGSNSESEDSARESEERGECEGVGKAGAETEEDVESPSAPPGGLYFQSFVVNMVDIKIDYSPKQINLHALQQGDYIQMLNLFSIDGLEITLTKVALTGISGLSAGLNKCLEEWVHEIYAHQIHRY